MATIANELVGKKVVVHVNSGGAAAQHRGVLEAADGHFFKLKKDSETLFIGLPNVISVAAV